MRTALIPVVFAVSLAGCASVGGGVGISVPVGPLSVGIGVGKVIHEPEREAP